jgi:hypothetical protein
MKNLNFKSRLAHHPKPCSFNGYRVFCCPFSLVFSLVLDNLS